MASLARRLEQCEHTVASHHQGPSYAARLWEAQAEVLERRRLGIPQPHFDVTDLPDPAEAFATRLWRARMRANSRA